MFVAKESLVLENDFYMLFSNTAAFCSRKTLSCLMMNTPHATMCPRRYFPQVQQLFGYSVNFFLKMELCIFLFKVKESTL